MHQGLNLTLCFCLVGKKVCSSSKIIDEKGQNGLEEERRLAYVGITRAKDLSFISFSLNRFYQGDWIDSLSSDFLDELPEKFIENNNLERDDQDFEFNQDLDNDNEDYEARMD